MPVLGPPLDGDDDELVPKPKDLILSNPRLSELGLRVRVRIWAGVGEWITRECGFVRPNPEFNVLLGLDMGELMVVLKSIRELSIGELGS